MPDIECTTIFGDKKLVPADKLVLRPAAYGVIEHEDKLLLVNTKSTGKWFFPGGAVELGEKLEEALHREIKEETGITVEVQKFFTFIESFFYYDHTDTAYQSLNFFYTCRPLETKLSLDWQEPGDEAEKCSWVDITELTPEAFQSFAGDIFQAYKTVRAIPQTYL